VVEAEGPVIVFSAEEKLKEMHRRTLHVLIEGAGDVGRKIEWFADHRETFTFFVPPLLSPQV
jgi:hypothetical protein